MSAALATADQLDEARAALAAGEAYDFKRTRVDAGWIRELVVGATHGGAVWIQNAVVDGVLNLRDARRRSGGPAGALFLEGCTLVGGKNGFPAVDASHAHIERLCLRGCTLSAIDLSNAVIAGELDLDGIHGSDGGPCWIKARELKVDGSVSARGAALSLPWPAGTDWPQPGWENVDPYALDLGGAEIRGSLMLWPGFEARGGVNVAGATVSGGIRAPGAKIDAAEIGGSQDALYAQNVRVNGHVFLSSDDDVPFRARGSLNLYGAEIEGALVMTGAEVTGVDTTTGDSALQLQSASISGDVLLYPSKLPSVTMFNATLGGRLDIWAPDTSPIENLDATTCHVRGQLLVGGGVSSANFAGSTIDGRVELGDEQWPLVLVGVNGSASLSLAEARIGGQLAVRSIDTRRVFTVSVNWRRPIRVMSRVLSCYPKTGWHLGVGLYPDTSGRGVAIVDFLFRTTEPNDVELVVLDGDAGRIHALSSELDLETEERALEYLTFFCANVWGDEGPFLIEPGTARVERTSTGDAWTANAEVEYGTSRFRAAFEIQRDGSVAMTDDEPVSVLPAETLERRIYARPVRWFKPDKSESLAPGGTPDWPAEAIIQPEDGWQDLEGSDRGLLLQIARKLEDADVPIVPAEELPPGWPRPTADLGGLKVGSLADDDGRAWFGRDEVRPRLNRFKRLLIKVFLRSRADELATTWPWLRLQLVGFEYERIQAEAERDKLRETRSITQAGALNVAEPGIASSLSGARRAIAATVARARTLFDLRKGLLRDLDRDPNELEARLTWLDSQYLTHPPARKFFQPEPYIQLARALRASGNLKGANRVMEAKIKATSKLRPNAEWPAPVKWAYRLVGLPVLLVMGTIGTAVVRPGRMLVIFLLAWVLGISILYAYPNALKVETSALSTVLTTRGGVVVQKNDVPATKQAKEIVCGGSISRVVYPIDVMIPFVDLRQESRCDFSANQQGWAIAKGFYALLGWILTAGLILAASGLVRRQFDF